MTDLLTHLASAALALAVMGGGVFLAIAAWGEERDR